MDHFLSLSALDDATLGRLLARARAAVRRPLGEALRGKVVGLVFQDPSLRTLASTQAAAAQLGGSSFVLQPGRGTWGLEVRDGVVMDGAAAEHVREAVPVLGSYADALGLRAFAGLADLAEDLSEPMLSAFVRYAGRPVINLESAFDHPCQALADWQTLDHFGVPAAGGRFVLSWAWHPKPLPQAVPAAVVAMAARRGMEVTVLRPEGFDLHPSVYARAAAEARRGGGSLTVTADREAALAGAHVLYAKSWAALPAWQDTAADAALRAPLLGDWCVAPEWFANAAPEARFMHCLPVRRNVVVADAVLDGPRSVVLTQAAHRLSAAKAVLTELLAPETAIEAS
jgi:N-acetylornithine carbamoyltransferase